MANFENIEKKPRLWNSTSVLDFIDNLEQNNLEEPSLYKKLPKDFEKENKKMIKDLQKRKREEKDKQFRSSSSKLSNSFDNVKSKVFDNKLASSDESVIHFSRKSRSQSASVAEQSKLHTPHPLGYKPPYLEKEKKKREANKRLEEEKNKAVLIPTGHMLLSDDDRVLTLKLLHKNHEELTCEFNKLPLVCDTFGTKNRKEILEKKLAKIEEGIEIFSKQIVFIKVGT